ncbi:acyltransferase domain-containing protein [Streptomyces sp. GD-15H]
MLLSRLSEARRAGLPVPAVVRGSAVDQNGTSNGLTAPHGPAQQRVIRQALTDAGPPPGDIDAVEAHGTGTRLGDVIEAEAFLAMYGREARERPLRLGSVKSNIGHTQAAAGVAGVIKTVQALAHDVSPRMLHADEPSRRVVGAGGAAEPGGGVAEGGPPAPGGGVLLRHQRHQRPCGPGGPEHPAAGFRGGRRDREGARRWRGGAGVRDCCGVGEERAGLRAQARRLYQRVAADPDAAPVDIGYSLATTRETFEHRAVVVARDRAELLTSLRVVAEGGSRPRVRTGTSRRRGPLAFLFTDQGSQHVRLGRELYESQELHPSFAGSFDECCSLLDPLLPVPLLDVVFAEPGTETGALLHTTRFAQPALFALETALFRLLEALGVHPDLVAGHSVGEVAAAHAAGGCCPSRTPAPWWRPGAG